MTRTELRTNPKVILNQMMKEKMSLTAAAKRAEVSLTVISRAAHEDYRVTPAVAAKLTDTFGTDAVHVVQIEVVERKVNVDPESDFDDALIRFVSRNEELKGFDFVGARRWVKDGEAVLVFERVINGEKQK